MKNLFASIIALATCGASFAQVATIQQTGTKAVALVRTPDSVMIYLSGSATVDARSVGQVSFRWFLASGAPVRIKTPDSLGTKVYGLTPGVYTFALEVADNRTNRKDTAYNFITVSK